jgi:hypothetical protein
MVLMAREMDFTSIHFVIDKHNVAVKPREGTWAISAIF